MNQIEKEIADEKADYLKSRQVEQRIISAIQKLFPDNEDLIPTSGENMLVCLNKIATALELCFEERQN